MPEGFFLALVSKLEPLLCEFGVIGIRIDRDGGVWVRGKGRREKVARGKERI